MMKIKFKIFRTTWVNILGVFLAVYLFAVATALTEQEQDFFTSLYQALVGSFFAIILYGAIFWVAFLIVLFILDMLLMNANMKNVNLRLLLEWFIISAPFVYWLIKHSEWVFLVAVLAFLITQYLRKEKILKILSSGDAL